MVKVRHRFNLLRFRLTTTENLSGIVHAIVVNKPASKTHASFRILSDLVVKYLQDKNIMSHLNGKYKTK